MEVETSEIVRNYAIVAAGLLGLGIGLWRAIAAALAARAARQEAAIARREHVTEVFGRAIALLADDKLEIRLGAIYTLQLLAADFSVMRKPVGEVLAASLSRRSQAREAPSSDLENRAIGATIAMLLRLDRGG